MNHVRRDEWQEYALHCLELHSKPHTYKNASAGHNGHHQTARHRAGHSRQAAIQPPRFNQENHHPSEAAGGHTNWQL
jgi:hypothetical protein